MMTSLSIQQISVTVPDDLLRHCTGLALDFGGSLVKVAYRSKVNSTIENGQNDDISRLHLISFPRRELAAALDYINIHADISRNNNGQPASILATGLGSTEFGKLISERLNVKLQNVTEFDCFVKAFYYLSNHLPRHSFCESYDIKVRSKSLEAFKATMKALGGTGNPDEGGFGLDMNMNFDPLSAQGTVVNDSLLPIAEAEEDLYPCILAMCGSAFAYMQINADGTFRLVDGSNRGGRSFHGLGSLLTGSKSYTELIELAANGRQESVDTFSADLFNSFNATEDEDSFYVKAAALQESMLIYSFGKCADAKVADFRREDVARALLNQSILDLVQSLTLSTLLVGIKRIFFCGSFLNEKVVKDMMTIEIVKRNLYYMAIGQPSLKFDFVKPGAYLGAIGVLLSKLEKST